jgi:hypothetical protein
MPDDMEDRIRSRVSQDPDRFTGDGDDKTVIGPPGTPRPTEEKPMLHVVYVLSGAGSNVVFTRDFEDEVQSKVDARQSLPEVTVRFLKSGSSSSKPFPEQAVFVRIRGDQLAVTETQLDEIAGIIARARDGVRVKERVYDTMA